MTVKAPPVWKRPAPANTTKQPLSPLQRELARARAAAAGRRYPNLIDNMWAKKQPAE